MAQAKSSASAHPSTRELRGLALYREYRKMFRFERGVWLVPSLSSGTTVYEVTLDPEAHVSAGISVFAPCPALTSTPPLWPARRCGYAPDAVAGFVAAS